jgi:hypothetical protein
VLCTQSLFRAALAVNAVFALPAEIAEDGFTYALAINKITSSHVFKYFLQKDEGLGLVFRLRYVTELIASFAHRRVKPLDFLTCDVLQ